MIIEIPEREICEMYDVPCMEDMFNLNDAHVTENASLDAILDDLGYQGFTPDKIEEMRENVHYGAYLETYYITDSDTYLAVLGVR